MARGVMGRALLVVDMGPGIPLASIKLQWPKFGSEGLQYGQWQTNPVDPSYRKSSHFVLAAKGRFQGLPLLICSNEEKDTGGLQRNCSVLSQISLDF